MTENATEGPDGAGSARQRDARLIEDVSQRALLQRAWKRLDRVSEVRDAARLSQAGLGEREIADVLRTTQPRVRRMLSAAAEMSLGEESPEELILRAAVDNTDRDALIERLSQMSYTFKEYAPAPFEGSRPGTWDQVTTAAGAGLLTRTEYEQIRVAVNPPA